MDNYLVVEFQTYADGTSASLKYEFDDQTMTKERRKALAEQKYHLVLAAAAVSECKIHAASLMDFAGRLIKREEYKHTEEEVAA